MPPVYDKPVNRVAQNTTPVSSVSKKPVVPVPGRSPDTQFVPLDSKKLRRSKFRIPVLQILASMSPGCGVPLKTLAYMVWETVPTKQDIRYFGGNLVQMTLGYTDRSKENRFEPTLLGLGYIAFEEAYVDDDTTETIYFITPQGRLALDDYESRVL